MEKLIEEVWKVARKSDRKVISGIVKRINRKLPVENYIV